MNRTFVSIVAMVTAVAGGIAANPTTTAPQDNAVDGQRMVFVRDQAKQALDRAVNYYTRYVAVEGTYLWEYSEDLSRREGEGVATATQGWVQPPGTPTVGTALLEAHAATGTSDYLEAARTTAYGLIHGQLRTGGWYYYIDFDPETKRPLAYRSGGRKAARATTTLDDDTTQAALRFLMRMDAVLGFKDERIHDAVVFALEALLKAQYANGAWPQGYDRFPDPAPVTRASFPEAWDREWPGSKEYWLRYTLNDNLHADMVQTLLLALKTYAQAPPDDTTRALVKGAKAALAKAGQFILDAQLPDPQPAWAQQYDAEMHPCWARKFEPPAVTGGESQKVLETLLLLFHESGEERYLEPIPRALEYLRSSRLDGGMLARFYELKSNKPLYFTRDYRLTYDDSDTPTHYAFKVPDRTGAIERAYRQALALRDAKSKVKPSAEDPRRGPSLEQVQAIIAGLDDRGRWVEDGPLRYHAPKIRGERVIRSATFARNVTLLSQFIESSEGTRHASSAVPNLVRLRGYSLCDNGGPFLGLGASYFQALHDAKHDRTTLDHNLALLASRGFNYVRVLSMVSWEGLEIAPVTFTNRSHRRVEGWTDYWQQFQAVLDLAGRHSLRVQVTVFADAQYVMPARSEREKHLDNVVANIGGREHEVLLLEVANEAWQNGFPGDHGIVELRAFAKRVSERTPVLVAMSAPAEVSPQSLAEMYQGSDADLATVHFSRDSRTGEGGWFPVRASFEAGRLPGIPPAVSNEPIGPGSSVAAESDPIKLCTAALFAYIANLPSYVFHSKTGIYGYPQCCPPSGERLQFESTVGTDVFMHVKQLLPPDVANWTRNDGIEPGAPFTTYCNGQPDQFWPSVSSATNGCVRNIGSSKGSEFVCLPIGILDGGLKLKARQAMTLSVWDPLTGSAVTNLSLKRHDAFALPQGPGAYLIKGTKSGR